MKVRILLVAIPLLVVGGVAILMWRMYATQRAEAEYHARLVRSVRISSDAFVDNGNIPTEFSCEGEGISPPLKWADLPEDTQSLVLLVTDEDLPAPGLSLFKIVHWVLYNIPGDVTGLDPGVTGTELSEVGVKVGPNWSRETRYYPPCPVSERHRYVFRLYALDVDTIQPRTDNRQGVLKAMENHVIAYGELSGFYKK
ncbi:MAG: YbhB/YbcL family Raf kinase inhibitor-like protein [Anaerolineae bacterium]|nr:YbhB/YbcL family Raf kinase inhibitor-like protein [Anaerolineae bacterium]